MPRIGMGGGEMLSKKIFFSKSGSDYLSADRHSTLFSENRCILLFPSKNVPPKIKPGQKNVWDRGPLICFFFLLLSLTRPNLKTESGRLHCHNSRLIMVLKWGSLTSPTTTTTLSKKEPHLTPLSLKRDFYLLCSPFRKKSRLSLLQM